MYLVDHSRVPKLTSAGWPMGWMVSATHIRRPRSDLPWALDNGLYYPPGEIPKPPTVRARIYECLSRCYRLNWPQPMFAVVPDVPYRGEESLALSMTHLPVLHSMFPKTPWAIAVQDGMNTPEARQEILAFDWIFVGGSTDWKIATGEDWCQFGHSHGKKVHIARVNTTQRLRQVQDWNADSADGSGIFRGDKGQLRGVLDALVQDRLPIEKAP